MTQLMMHVERIVRPVAAFAPRKLRMRRELLAHLQQAVDEERAQSAGDEPVAVERAVHRLGDPRELTRQLQQTVPLIERLLMSNLPIPKSLEQAEQRAARKLYGHVGRLTMGHQAILVLLAGPLAWLPGYTPRIVRDVLTHTGTVAHPAMFFCGILLSIGVLLALAFRLVNAAAEPGRPLWRTAVIAPMIALMAMQFAFPFIAAATVADRLPTVFDVACTLGVTAGLVFCSILLARWVARLRLPYDQWLALDLAS